MTACDVCQDPLRPADRRYQGPCAACGKPTCPRHTFFYTDESNIAITMSARPMCKEHAL